MPTSRAERGFGSAPTTPAWLSERVVVDRGAEPEHPWDVDRQVELDERWYGWGEEWEL